MRLSSSAPASLLLLPALVSANIAWRPNAYMPQMTPAPTVLSPPSQSQQQPSEQIPTMTSIITSTSISITTSPSQSHAWDPLVSGASYLLDELDDHFHIDLRKRQGNVAATNIMNPAITQPTQMPSVTVYDMYDGKMLTYTQTFPAVNEQWPSPEPGAIGLGTIQGQIGVIKTVSKRAEPTAITTASTKQVVKIKGREVTMS